MEFNILCLEQVMYNKNRKLEKYFASDTLFLEGVMGPSSCALHITSGTSAVDGPNVGP